MLLGLDGLVEPLIVAAPKHQTAGELVHNDDLAILDHIVDVLLHHAPGLDSLVDVVGQGGVLRISQVFNVEEGLRLFDAGSGEGGGPGLFIHDIVRVDIRVLFLFFIHLRDALAF